MKNSNITIRNRTSDLPICSTAPSPLCYRGPQGSHVPLVKFHMAPIFSSLTSSGPKKNEFRYACLSEAKASHSHKMPTEVSPLVPHFLQVGLLLSPITWGCFLRALCPVRRPITTLDFVLLKDNNRALVARLGPEINYQACLCVLQGPHHNTKCRLSFQHF